MSFLYSFETEKKADGYTYLIPTLPDVYDYHGNKNEITYKILYERSALTTMQQREYCPKTLYCLLLGMEDNYFKTSEFINAPEMIRKDYIPERKHLYAELHRRLYYLTKEHNNIDELSNIFADTQRRCPRPKAWIIPQFDKWLLMPSHQINTEADKIFLRESMKNAKITISALIRDALSDDYWARTQWNGLKSSCRLISVATHPSIRNGLLMRYRIRPKKGETLDATATTITTTTPTAAAAAGGGSSRAAAKDDIFEQMANLFNDETYKCYSIKLPTNDFGDYFVKHYELTKCSSFGRVTGDEIHIKLDEFIKMIRKLKFAWEQADGAIQRPMYNITEAAMGTIMGVPSSDQLCEIQKIAYGEVAGSENIPLDHIDLQNGWPRHIYLNEAIHPIALYMWCVLENCQMLDTCLYRTQPGLSNNMRNANSNYSSNNNNNNRNNTSRRRSSSNDSVVSSLDFSVSMTPANRERVVLKSMKRQLSQQKQVLSLLSSTVRASNIQHILMSITFELNAIRRMYSDQKRFVRETRDQLMEAEDEYAEQQQQSNGMLLQGDEQEDEHHHHQQQTHIYDSVGTVMQRKKRKVERLVEILKEEEKELTHCQAQLTELEAKHRLALNQSFVHMVQQPPTLALGTTTTAAAASNNSSMLPESSLPLTGRSLPRQQQQVRGKKRPLPPML